ncbi:uncharacterized protein [Typha latifolia]|uniref:uncharacterized protein n=1 Tax=Typha latifolia TaxID=4733 RepID=UPI003C2F6CF2
MKKEDLDFVLVPLGLTIMVAYHVWLVYRVLRHPTKTVIGINAINRRIWVENIMEDPAKNGILGVQTLRNNIMASTLLASTAIMLASLIALLMTSSSSRNNESGSNSHVFRGQNIVFGDRSDLGLSIKFFAILVCFVLAFLLIVQSVRYYSHASLLISVPVKRQRMPPEFAAEYVARALNKGSYFWSLGLHVLYISLPLFIWVFGPIPMVLCSFILVCLLYFLDAYSGYGVSSEEEEKRRENGSVTALELGLGTETVAVRRF